MNRLWLVSVAKRSRSPRAFAALVRRSGGARSGGRCQSFSSGGDGIQRGAPGATTPSAALAAAVASGELTRDARQDAVIALLDGVHAAVVAAATGGGGSRDGARSGGGGAGFFGALFGRPAAASSASAAAAAPRPPLFGPASAPRGLYLWGGTGSGKTRLMDLFFASLPRAVPSRRAHFHAFMLDVHARLHAARVRGERGDPLARVAAALLAEARVLCFDEFQVTDVGDAMIMRRLFGALWAGGLTVVATSNRPPEQLYANGLQRELFLPFLDDLARACAVHHLDSDTDYRALATPLRAGSAWISPETLAHGERHGGAVGGGGGTDWRPLDAAVDALWLAATRGAAPAPVTLDARGRPLTLPRAVLRPPAVRAARANFSALCGEALYAADYAAIAGAFRVLFLERVPRLSLGTRNEVRRLITLVDVLYDANAQLVVSAETTPQRIFSPTFPGADAGADAGAGGGAAAAAGGGLGGAHGGASHAAAARRHVTTGDAARRYDEVFAFDRTVSRLLEMQSEEYLGKSWAPAAEGGGQ